MPVKLKWDVDGKGEEAWGGGDRYDGPVPPKGSYIAKIKRMTQGKIAKEGENKGKPRLSILCEIVSGQGADGIDDENYKYRGAPVWDGVNIIKAQAGRANMFIHALTDGTDNAKRAVENKFWPPNMDVRAEKVKITNGTRAGQVDIHIKSIGSYKIGSPDGELLVRIVTKMGQDLQGNPRAEINQYLPYLGAKPSDISTKSDEDEDEILDADIDDEDEVEELDVDDEELEDAEEDDVEDEPPF